MTTATDRMTGAEFAARRHLLGLTLDELASILGVNPRTVRAWEAERDPIPPRVPDELDALIVEHTTLTQEVAAAGSMQIVRARHDGQDRPRGWHVAAAARATATHPGLRVEWIEATPEMIYDRIDRLRRDVYAELGHTVPLASLDADDWTEDDVMGRTLGDPGSDWCVDIRDGDIVQVFAAGDVVAQAVIPGASTL